MRGLLSPLIKLDRVPRGHVLRLLCSRRHDREHRLRFDLLVQGDFTDSPGLNVGDDVRIAGVRVGTVTGVKLVHHDHCRGVFTVVRSRPLPHVDDRADPVPEPDRPALSRHHPGRRRLRTRSCPTTACCRPARPRTRSTSRSCSRGFKPLFQGLNPSRSTTCPVRSSMALQGEGGTIELLMGNLADLTNSLADKDQVIGERHRQPDTRCCRPSAVTTRELSDLIVQLQGFISGLAQDRTHDRHRDRRDQRAAHLDGRPAHQRPCPAGQGHHRSDRADRTAQPQHADAGLHAAAPAQHARRADPHR